MRLGLSNVADVNDYHCDECGLVWNVARFGEPTVTIVASPEWPVRNAARVGVADQSLASSSVVVSRKLGFFGPRKAVI